MKNFYKLNSIRNFFLICFLLFSNMLFANSINLTTEEQKYLANNKIITMCNNPNIPPFEFAKNGNMNDMQGIAIDLLKLIENELSITFKNIPTSSWSESQEFLKDKKCDILPFAVKNRARTQYANFTKPYLVLPLGIFTQKNEPFVTGLDDLEGQVMSSKKGSSLISIIKRKYPNLMIQETASVEQSLQDVNNENADFIISNIPTVAYYMSKNLLNNLQISGYIKVIGKASIAIQKDDILLFAILEKTLQNIPESAIDKIYKKWVTPKLQEVKVNYTFLWQILFGISILLIFIFYRQYILYKANKELHAVVAKKTEKLNNLNVTLEKRIDDKIHELKNSLKIISKNVIYSRLNLNGVIIEVSDAFCEISLFTKEELIGSTQNIIKHPDLLESTWNDMWENVQNGQVWHGEIINKTKDGGYYWVDLDISPEFMENGEISSYVAICHDITAKKDFEKQHIKLIKAERLSNMGEMIGNIAHQWRQPLSVITTASTGSKLFKEMDLLTDDIFIKNMDTINKNAQYLSQTIDDFRNFIKGDISKESFVLNDNMDSFLHLVEGTIKNNYITMILQLEDDMAMNSYPNELIQCFINIFNNSKDVLININEKDRFVFITAYTQNDKVIISFKDSAGGIPDAVLPRIFEPYFTTKYNAQGTGLGLHMTYNLIVDGMKGSIEAKNVDFIHEGKEYKGAEFLISLPK